ncbi:hypothetical protein Ancab_026349 [Ancistrocladus abbreviatus]
MATTGKLLLALVALSALAATGVANRPLPHQYTVEGKVYCDTCRCGFETSATVYIPGAKVRLECRGREDLRLMYSVNGETDSNGKFLIHVDEDHQEQICDVVLVSSPWGNCRTADPGRSSTRVIVTNNNGIRSYKRFANNMGFLRDHALPLCGELLKYYLQSDDE